MTYLHGLTLFFEMKNYGRSKIYCTPHGIHVEYKMTTTKNSVYTKLHQIYIFDRRQEQRTKWSTDNIRVTIQWNYRYTKSGIYRTTSGCQIIPYKTISGAKRTCYLFRGETVLLTYPGVFLDICTDSLSVKVKVMVKS